jgi:hypothetical protein
MPGCVQKCYNPAAPITKSLTLLSYSADNTPVPSAGNADEELWSCGLGREKVGFGYRCPTFDDNAVDALATVNLKSTPPILARLVVPSDLRRTNTK